MARARKRHVQLELPAPPKRKRYYKPTGNPVGRPPKNAKRPSQPHKQRIRFDGRHPLHVTLRLAKLPSLRKRGAYHAIRFALFAVAKYVYASDGVFRICHVSIQRDHIHLIVEAANQPALSRGMQAFQISAARRLNHVFGRTGKVFPDRFHANVLSTPTQVRNTLAYVLNNWRKHEEDRQLIARDWSIDPFSTGVLFDGWKGREGESFLRLWRDSYTPLLVCYPQTWLLAVGWRKAPKGLIALTERPPPTKR